MFLISKNIFYIKLQKFLSYQRYLDISNKQQENMKSEKKSINIEHDK